MSAGLVHGPWRLDRLEGSAIPWLGHRVPGTRRVV